MPRGYLNGAIDAAAACLRPAEIDGKLTPANVRNEDVEIGQVELGRARVATPRGVQ
jgi:hypothetical protein